MDEFLEGSGGFILPPDSGVTPLPFGADHGLCMECEGHSASFALERAGESPLRICHHCLFRRFAPPPTTWSEMLDNEARQLAEAERTATPEQLGHMIEFLEEWWSEQARPMPSHVSEFIARHRASALAPAVSSIEGTLEPEDLEAARIALLVMRGALAEKKVIDEQRYVIEPEAASVTREVAADRLARMPKPLHCHARAEDGVMTIRCRTMTSASELRVHEPMAEDARSPQLLEEERESDANARIFCAGWRESLVATTAGVERYRRDYDVRPMGTNASPPSFYLATNPDAARAAAAAGATLLMKCHFASRDWAPENEGRVIDVRESETWNYPEVFALSPDLETTCEECGLRPAIWRATNTQFTPWRERALCEQCTAAAIAARSIADGERYERWVSSLSEKGRRAASDDLAAALERLERWWKRLPMPPEVAAVMERCRALHR